MIDIQISVVTTQYEAEKKTVQIVKKIKIAAFPQKVKVTVQYEKIVRTLVVYLTEDNMISCNRTQRLLKDVTGLEISKATLVNINREFTTQLEQVLSEIKRRIKISSVVGFDETSMRKKLKNKWFYANRYDTFIQMGYSQIPSLYGRKN